MWKDVGVSSYGGVRRGGVASDEGAAEALRRCEVGGSVRVSAHGVGGVTQAAGIRAEKAKREGKEEEQDRSA